MKQYYYNYNFDGIYYQAINGSMDEAIRKQPIQISCFVGKQRYCIFCKIEEGSV